MKILSPIGRIGLLLALVTLSSYGTPSGLNNIPTADTTPQGTLVLQVFSTVG